MDNWTLNRYILLSNKSFDMLHTAILNFCPGDSESSYSPATKTSLWISSFKHFFEFGDKWNISAFVNVKQIAKNTKKAWKTSISTICVVLVCFRRCTFANVAFGTFRTFPPFTVVLLNPISRRSNQTFPFLLASSA